MLKRAGAAHADILIALTNSDEVNMVACAVDFRFFDRPGDKTRRTRIARIRSAEYLQNADSDKALFGPEAIPIDVYISPEQLVTDHIEELVHFPGAFQVLDFAGGQARLVGARALEGGMLVNQQIKSLKEHIPGVETRIAAIYRQGQSITPDGSTLIREDDEVFFIAATKDIRLVMSEMRRPEESVRRITIAGGGAVGYRLARRLEMTNQVKVIERDRNRARQISERLAKAIVLHGDARRFRLRLHLLDQDAQQISDIHLVQIQKHFVSVASAEK